MPEALIVTESECLKRGRKEIDYKKVVNMLVKRNIIKVSQVHNQQVWTRPYLKPGSARKAFLKQNRIIVRVSK